MSGFAGFIDQLKTFILIKMGKPAMMLPAIPEFIQMKEIVLCIIMIDRIRNQAA